MASPRVLLRQFSIILLLGGHSYRWKDFPASSRQEREQNRAAEHLSHGMWRRPLRFLQDDNFEC